MFPASVFDASVPPVLYPVEELRAQADRDLDVFDERARQADVHSFERRRVDDDAGLAIALQARYSDLVVLSQSSTDEFLPRLRSDFPEYVILQGARPVLVLPTRWQAQPIGRRVTVAWNGSNEALRAITSAIPLLKHATKVDLVVLDTDENDPLHGHEPGADLALYLARHGIKVELSLCPGEPDAGTALLQFARDKASDLIVMGAYGHSRFREFMLGGATKTALQTSTLPLWMAH